MADMEILQKAVNAEAGSERFDAFIDAGFADIVCRRHELREWIIWIFIVSSFPLARPPQRGIGTISSNVSAAYVSKAPTSADARRKSGGDSE